MKRDLLYKFRNIVLSRISKTSILYSLLKVIYLRVLSSSHNPEESVSNIDIEISKIVNTYKSKNYGGSLTTPKVTECFNDLRALENSSVLVILPVYNRFDLVSKLLRSLHPQILKIKKQNISIKVLVADDHSHSRTSEKLKKLCNNLGFKYIYREKNLGVVVNVNEAYETNNSDFVFLLNSDVSIDDHFIEKMLEPFASLPKLGIVTAPTFELVKSHIRNSEIKNWRQYNQFLNSKSLLVVDACTAVSYAIAIRRAAVSENYLMDVSFGMGYGEDSDLHYRVVENGYRSVWNLSTVVAHLSGGSFSLSKQHFEHRINGAKIFFERWGARYLHEIKAHDSILTTTLEEITNKYSGHTQKSVWILSPGVNSKIGGLSVVARLCERLIFAGNQAYLVDLSDSKPQILDDAYETVDRKYFESNCKVNDKVLIVGLGGFRYWQGAKRRLPSLDATYYLQGPDHLIDPSGIPDFEEMEESINSIAAVSPAMLELARIIAPTKRTFLLQAETDDAFFSINSETFTHERSYDVIFCLRKEHGKASWLSIAIANQLSNNCRVAVFGHHEGLELSNRITLLGNVEHRDVLHLLRNSKVYVDSSLFEGFGMLPREAADSGAHVFFMANTGGLDVLNQYSKHFSVIKGFWNLNKIAQEILQKINFSQCPGCSYCMRTTTQFKFDELMD